MRRVALWTAIAFGAGFVVTASGADAPAQPAPLPTRPVTETLWGQKVVDPYRYTETLGPDTLDWIQAQGRYTRAMLDAIPARAALGQKIAAFTGRVGLVRGTVRYGGRTFFLERAPGSDDFDLVVRDAGGQRRLVDSAALNRAAAGAALTISYFFVAPDGSKVAVGLADSGSEATALHVYDAGTGHEIATPLERADPGFVSWSEDSKRVYVTRLKKLRTGEDEIEKYRNASLEAWSPGAEPAAILGSKAGHGPAYDPDETPALAVWPGASVAAALSYNGVQNEIAMWLAPANRIDDPGVLWQPFLTRDDEVTAAVARGDQLFLLSHKNAPTFQVLSVVAGKPLASARVRVPAATDRVLDAVHAASDALYVLARQGAYSVLLRAPHDSSAVETITLPFKGVITEAFADPRRPGLVFSLESFVVPPRTYSYDPSSQRFDALLPATKAANDESRYEILDLEARSHDGVRVPDTLVRPRGATGPGIVVIQAYGAYGYSQLANFSLRAASLLEAGGSYASCHVRGGGELGEAWRLAGKDANKPNSWRDLIACAEDLVARGITTRDRLFVFSGSAGGITIGRAMTERPDLFAGVLAMAPGVNTLRQETQPNGPLNVPEFGTVETEPGFRNLLEMDTLQHIRAGVQYPSILITTGLKDPRVAPWEAAKFASALLASGTRNPVLLRVDAEAGHGGLSGKSQDDELYADFWAFVFWRAGLPGWQPVFGQPH